VIREKVLRERHAFDLITAIGLWYRDVSCEEIATRLGLRSGAAVAKRLRAAGVSVPPRPAGPDAAQRGPARARSADVEADIVGLHEAGGMSFAALGEMLGVSKQRAHAIYKRAKHTAARVKIEEE
jgi:transposase